MQKSEFGGCFHLQLFVLLTFWKFKSFLLPSLSVPLSWLPLSWSLAFRVLYYLPVKVFWCPEVSKFTTISRSQEIQWKNSPDCFVGSHLSARYLNGSVALLEEIFWPTALAKGRTFDSGFRGVGVLVKGIGAKAYFSWHWNPILLLPQVGHSLNCKNFIRQIP